MTAATAFDGAAAPIVHEKALVRSLQELIGRTEFLETLEGQTERQRKLDLKPLLSVAGIASDAPQFCVTPSNAPFDKGELAERMVKDMLPSIEGKQGGEWKYEVHNYNRSIGARNVPATRAC